jgi:hypothetical protein
LTRLLEGKHHVLMGSVDAVIRVVRQIEARLAALGSVVG